MASIAPGSRWFDPITTGAWSWAAGAPRVITFSFASDERPGYNYTAEQKQWVRAAFASCQAIMNVQFVETDDVKNSNIVVGFLASELEGSLWGQAGIAIGATQGGMAIRRSALTDTPQTWGIETLLHEIGHLSGFAHTDEFVENLKSDPSLINWEYFRTTASSAVAHDGGLPSIPGGYSWHAITLMAWDIAVLQRIYGVNSTAGAGDTVYRLKDGSNTMSCIWDTSGTDTIVYDGENRVYIRLRAATLGKDTEAFGAPSYAMDVNSRITSSLFMIANGVVIENASGGQGNDTIEGNEVANRLEGNGGKDSLVGADGNDTLLGGVGDDTLVGGAGDDVYVWNLGDGADNIVGYGGNDTLLLGVRQADVAFSYDGSDVLLTIFGTTIRLVGQLSGGVNTIQFTDGAWIARDLFKGITITGTNGNDVLNTSAVENATIYGGGGDDLITAGSGNDSIDGGNGRDTIYGGDGNDLINKEFASSGLSHLYGGAGNDYIDVWGLYDAWSYGGEGNDSIYGSYGYNLIYGGVGRDTIHSWGGSDDVFGDAGDDFISADKSSHIYGGEGNDTLFGRSGNSTLDGGSGNDLYGWSGAGTQQISDSGGTDTLELKGVDPNTVRFLLVGNDVVLVTPTGSMRLVGQALGGIESITFFGSSVVWSADYIRQRVINAQGTDGADRFTRSATASGWADDSIDGGAGDDTIETGAGNDRLIGGAGNDSLDGGDGDDQFIWSAGGGTDTVVGGSGIDTLWLNDVDARSVSVILRGTEVWLIWATGSICLGKQASQDAPDVEFIYFKGGAIWTAETIRARAMAVLSGTSQADALTRTATAPVWANDKIYGNGGKDTIDGGGRQRHLIRRERQRHHLRRRRRRPHRLGLRGGQ